MNMKVEGRLQDGFSRLGSATGWWKERVQVVACLAFTATGSGKESRPPPTQLEPERHVIVP